MLMTNVSALCNWGARCRFSTTHRDRVSDASGTTTCGYDALGNLVLEDTPEGTINYAYDPVTGSLIRNWTANNDTAYGYDDQGRLEHVYATAHE